MSRHDDLSTGSAAYGPMGAEYRECDRPQGGTFIRGCGGGSFDIRFWQNRVIAHDGGGGSGGRMWRRDVEYRVQRRARNWDKVHGFPHVLSHSPNKNAPVNIKHKDGRQGSYRREKRKRESHNDVRGVSVVLHAGGMVGGCWV